MNDMEMVQCSCNDLTEPIILFYFIAGIMAVMPAVLVDILGTDLVVVASGYYIFTHGSANLLVHLAAGMYHTKYVFVF